MVTSEEEEYVGESQDPHLWEDRTLNLLLDSKIDQELSDPKGKKKKAVWKKHKVKWMKKSMGIPDVILELQEEDIRENALRCFSNFLLEDLTGASLKMMNGGLNVRAARRLANVLTLFQTVAANKETRLAFVQSRIPDFVIPIIIFESTDDMIDNLRAVSLSVIGILCQAREPEVIGWAAGNVVEACSTAIEIGSELCKVIAKTTRGSHTRVNTMTVESILESILQDNKGLSYICDPLLDWRLLSLTGKLSDLEFPVIKRLHHQLLLYIGRATDTSPLPNQRCNHPSEKGVNYGTATSGLLCN